MKKLLLLLLIPYSLLHSPLLCVSQYNILHDFDGMDGKWPYASLTLALDKFYGMTTDGGVNGDGCIFEIDTSGSGYSDLFDFNGTNGKQPCGSLLLSGSRLYGMTFRGGANNLGCIFSIDTNGSGYIDFHDFDANSAQYPYGSLIISGNILFGMTSSSTMMYWNGGAIFSIHTDGSSFKVLYYFNSLNNNDLQNPYGDLTLSGRSLFGMTPFNGTYGHGGIFSIDTSGSAYRELFAFNDTDGEGPVGSLTLSGKVLYGMTGAGGPHNVGVIFSIDTDGSRFKDLFYFKGDSNGEYPGGNLTLSGKRIFGMTGGGGGYEDGLIFSIDTDGGNYKRMFLFDRSNGAYPNGSLTMIGPNLYGMTSEGGAQDSGVIFRADTSLNDTSSIMTGVGQLSVVSGQWSVFPNPSAGVFTVAIVGAKNFSPAIIEVYNVFGQRVETQCIASLQKPAQFNIDLREKPNGVYFYRIVDENGGNIGTGKLVIEH